VITSTLRDAVQTMGQGRMEVPCINGDADKIRSANYETVNGEFFSCLDLASFYATNIRCANKLTRYK
jgi:hypothetical protein